MSASHEREVILSLFQAGDWFDLFDLHEALLLSPAQIASVVGFLEENGLCVVKATKARLTDRGVRWVLRNRRKIFMGSNLYWKTPERKADYRLEVGEPYMPNLKSVDKDFFEKLS